MVSRGKYILSQFGLFVRELRIFGGCYVAGGTAVTCSRRNCPKQTNTKGNDFEDYSLLLSCTSLNVPFCPVYKPVVLSLDSLVCGTLFFWPSDVEPLPGSKSCWRGSLRWAIRSHPLFRKRACRWLWPASQSWPEQRTVQERREHLWSRSLRSATQPRMQSRVSSSSLRESWPCRRRQWWKKLENTWMSNAWSQQAAQAFERTLCVCTMRSM